MEHVAHVFIIQCSVNDTRTVHVQVSSLNGLLLFALALITTTDIQICGHMLLLCTRAGSSCYI